MSTAIHVNGHVNGERIEQLEKFLAMRQGRIFLQAFPSRHFRYVDEPNAEKLDRAIRSIETETTEAVFFGINPVKPGITKAPQCEDIECRRFIFLDVDHQDHDKKIAATDEGKRAACEVFRSINTFLTKLGWPAPAKIDSGNGPHGYWFTDLPNDDATTKLIQALLDALWQKFGPLVDTANSDARRLGRMPGTMNRRGENTAERPHRLCRAIDVPEHGQLVTAEMIRAAIAIIGDEMMQSEEREGQRHQQTHEPYAGGGLKPGEDFNRRAAWNEILEPHGNKIDHQNGKTTYWTRAGKTDGTSATTGYCSTEKSGDMLYVWSSNMPPFEERTSYSKFHAYTLLNHNGDFKAAAKDLASKGYGDQTRGRRAAVASTNQSGVASLPDDSLVGVIKTYLRAKLQPTFKRGAEIYSSTLQRAVTRAEACAAPTSDIIPALMASPDFPRGEQGAKLSAVPSVYRNWSPIAYSDLLAELPDEADAPEIADSAAEQFQAVVADALMSIEAFGYNRGRDQDHRIEVQRRSLLDWARLFAKPGPWQSIRSLALWCKLAEDGQLQVAMHQRLFGQLRRGASMPVTHRRFSSLCESYGVGIGSRTSRSRFVELSPEFVVDLLDSPNDTAPCDGACDGDGDAQSHAHACVCGASPSSSHAPSHADEAV